MPKTRIGILTGGGDCAGINPAIKWAVKTALDERLEQERGGEFGVVGIRDGWLGLIDPTERVIPLDQETVRTWDRYGGTYLGTTRTNPFNPDRSDTVLSSIKSLELDAIIAIGGDDTLGVAHKLGQQGVNVVCIPKTIDNDLAGTDYTLGFETALHIITEEVDRLRTTAGSHRRIFVVETMGRYAGWLALKGGESAGAYIILIPEYPFSVNRINQLILEGRRAGNRYQIIVVAEGARPASGAEFFRNGTIDGFGHKPLGGVGEYLAREIQAGTGLESRCVVLSHLQRGGAPCAYDRRMGRYFGIAAVDLVIRHQFGRMVSYWNGEITSVPLEEVIGRPHLVDVAAQYDTDRYNGCRTILRQEAVTSPS
jgi:6-phosphofructokinase 1